MNIVQPDIRQLMSPMVYKVFMSQDVSGVASYNLTSNNYKKQQKITSPAYHLMLQKELLLIASRELFRLTKVVKKK